MLLYFDLIIKIQKDKDKDTKTGMLIKQQLQHRSVNYYIKTLNIINYPSLYLCGIDFKNTNIFIIGGWLHIVRVYAFNFWCTLKYST